MNSAIDHDTLMMMLGFDGIEIDSVKLTEQKELHIRISSNIEGTICHKCGNHIDTNYGMGQEIKLRHLPMLGYSTYIFITPPRYKCPHCGGTTTQNLPWYTRKSSYTNKYAEHLLLQLVNSTVKDVSIKENIGYDVIEKILDDKMLPNICFDDIKRIDTIGVDEISIKKGHKDFVVIVTAIINGELRVLSILEDRKKDTVKRFFLSIPKRLRKRVGSICSDLYVGFINAAKEVFGEKVLVVADRFHIARLYQKALDNLRKSEMKKLRRKMVLKEYKKLKNVMWILRKDPSELTEDEKDILKLLFRNSPKLEKGYDLCKELRGIFEEDIDRGLAARRINKWIKCIKREKLTSFYSFCGTVSENMREITNYFVKRDNSGFVEGLNNKIKVLKRRCYGIRNIKHLFQRIRLDTEGYSLLGKMPESKAA